MALIEAAEHELPEMLAAAAALRDRGKGRTVTYSRKVFLPLTNLCRDDCGYCTFKRDPGQPGARTMELDEVLAVCEAGARLGCKEALLSLGDKPEARFPEHREWLRHRGYRTTMDYVAAASKAIATETGLLPHANPGLMTERDLAALRPWNVSVGLMLETVADRLTGPGGPHERAPDKRPARRLRTLEAAGRAGIAFTTGILIGIGETRAERVDALLAIRELHERHGHIQEVIIQNFRAKPSIPMARHPEPSLDELRRTLAVARLLLGPVDERAGSAQPLAGDLPRPDRVGAERLGRRLAPHHRLHQPRSALAPPGGPRGGDGGGGRAAPRAARHLSRVRPPARLRAGAACATASSRRWTAPGSSPSGRPAGRGPSDRLPEDRGRVMNENGRMSETFLARYWGRLDPPVRAALDRALDGREVTGGRGRWPSPRPRARTLAALALVADELRARQAGDVVTYVVNRNINFTNVCIKHCGFCAFSRDHREEEGYLLPLEEVVRRAREAWDLGRHRGVHPGGAAAEAGRPLLHRPLPGDPRRRCRTSTSTPSPPRRCSTA